MLYCSYNERGKIIETGRFLLGQNLKTGYGSDESKQVDHADAEKSEDHHYKHGQLKLRGWTPLPSDAYASSVVKKLELEKKLSGKSVLS